MIAASPTCVGRLSHQRFLLFDCADKSALATSRALATFWPRLSVGLADDEFPTGKAGALLERGVLTSAPSRLAPTLVSRSGEDDGALPGIEFVEPPDDALWIVRGMCSAKQQVPPRVVVAWRAFDVPACRKVCSAQGADVFSDGGERLFYRTDVARILVEASQSGIDVYVESNAAFEVYWPLLHRVLTDAIAHVAEEHGWVSVHASAVVAGKRCALLVGDSGIGKTTLARALGRVVSDELTLWRSAAITSALRTVTIRESLQDVKTEFLPQAVESSMATGLFFLERVTDRASLTAVDADDAWTRLLRGRLQRPPFVSANGRLCPVEQPIADRLSQLVDKSESFELAVQHGSPHDALKQISSWLHA